MRIGMYHHVIFSKEELFSACSTLAPSETQLDLSYKELNELPIDALIKSLALPINITSLNLGGNRLSTLSVKALTQIFTTLSKLTKLTSLNLSDNGFGDLFGKKLTKIFAALSNITSLNLSYNALYKLSDDAWAQILAVFFPNLISLNLDSNHLYYSSDALAKGLSALARNIKFLSLSDNGFGKLSGLKLASIFAAPPLSLTKLQLSDNGFYSSSQNLINALPSLALGITSVNFSGNGFHIFSDDELAGICAAIGPNIIFVDLSDNCFQSTDAFFSFPSNVTSVKLQEHFSSIEMLIKFCQAFPPSVTLFNLSRNCLQWFKRHELSRLFQVTISDGKILILSLNDAISINTKHPNVFVENYLCSDVIRLEDNGEYIDPLSTRANANIYRALGIKTPVPKLVSTLTLFSAKVISKDELTASALPNEVSNPIFDLTSSLLPGQQMIIHYLKRQMSRLPESSKKQVLQASLLAISAKKLTLDEFKAEITTIKNTVVIHRDTALLGFFKANFMRNTQSYNELMVVLKNKPLSELFSNDDCENNVSLHR